MTTDYPPRPAAATNMAQEETEETEKAAPLQVLCATSLPSRALNARKVSNLTPGLCFLCSLLFKLFRPKICARCEDFYRISGIDKDREGSLFSA
jgi:hypothetical protein